MNGKLFKDMKVINKNKDKIVGLKPNLQACNMLDKKQKLEETRIRNCVNKYKLGVLNEENS